MLVPPAAARRAWLCATMVALLVGGSVTSAAAAETPSWSDVQDARKNQAASSALVTRLQAALDDAEARAAALSSAALEEAAAAQQARADADAAESRATTLTAQDERAQAELSTVRGELGILASGLYRTQSDGALLGRLLTTSEPESLLHRLALLDRLSGTWAGMVTRAHRTARTADALRAQAADAAAERDEAARTAEATASTAQAAADAESATVEAVREQVETMYAQLATLKSTTAEAERRYRLDRQSAIPAVSPGPSGPSGAAPGTGGTGSGGTGSGGTGSGGTGSGGTGSGSAPTGVSVDPAGAKAYARTAVGRYGWGEDEYQCLVLLWNRESGWRADALNRSSGAYGIPQSLPAEKMVSAGADWRTNGNTQVDWGLSYINGRYGSPCGAWAHSQRTGWY